jgi:hypothetical protein
MFGHGWFVDGGVLDGEPGVVVEVDPLVAAPETALPTPSPIPTVPPRTPKPRRILANRLLMFSFLSGGDYRVALIEALETGTRLGAACDFSPAASAGPFRLMRRRYPADP